MKTLERPAAIVQQGDLTIYSTSLKVSDFLVPGFYQIDKLDSGEETTGYQRVLEERRSKKLSDYILSAWEDGDAFLPTSVFLATDKNVEYDSEKNIIKIDIGKVGPFNVVDGQHRIEGLRRAAEENPEIKDFQVAANIAINLNLVSQMCHFLIVNSTQRSVDKAVVQQILARLTGMVDIEEIPTLPKWIQRQINKGDDQIALQITNYLNEQSDSPWNGRIQMANELKGPRTSIAQKSFVTSLKKYVLASTNPISTESDIDRRNKILKNYWKAIADLLYDEDIAGDSVLFKTSGFDLFNIISTPIFIKLYVIKDFKVETITDLLRSTFDKLPEEYIKINDPAWWEKGSGASDLNSSAVRRIAHAFTHALLSNDDRGKISL